MAQGKLPPCKCAKMMKTLAKLGAKHAAYMHYVMIKDPNYKWTPQDWELHFTEEERYVFPVLMKFGLRDVVRRLAAEHNVLRQQLRRTGDVDRALLDRHSNEEDEIILRLVAA